MSLTFGTDGVRGLANAELSPELVLALGRAAARVLGPGPWVIGRDTRRSGPLLQAVLSAGLASEGAEVVDLGVVPTPAVAHASAVRDSPGAVVSASHNPFPDNGIKFFAPGGRKLTDEVEERLEDELRSILGGGAGEAKVAGDVGDITVDRTAAAAYAEHLNNALEGRTLDGLRIILDCANGAASELAGEVFRRAGSEVTVLHAQPDGTNINHGCGSTHPESLQEAVRSTTGVSLGLAFDGDADRVLAVAPDGELIDGDVILSLAARDLRERDALHGGVLVVTVMSNLGLRLAMADAGIEVVETKVGDRYVLEALEDGGYSLGGEQSGHVIFRDLATTGDGMLTGLLLADIVARRGEPFDAMARGAMTRLPQVLKNVRVADRDAVSTDPAVADAVAAVEKRLDGKGRVLLRPSGTEPLVRVMVEAPTHDEAEQAVDELVSVIAASAST
ncbi:MAG TPA: phosphoglucosamine mutase [Acidimicrobiales bacterium]|nr:phosphoglucosamine mutase [Acidimicrobiales bacterium]